MQYSQTPARTHHIAYLSAGTCALLVLGLIYAWSIFALPIGAEYGERFGWAASSLSVVFSVSMISFCAFALLSSYLMKLTSVRVVIVIAAGMLLAGFVLTSLLAGSGILALCLCYGVLAGGACGVGYNTIISTVNQWFPDAIGLSSGILMMGFGLGSLILGTIASALIAAFTWHTTFIIIGIFGAGVLAMAAIVIRPVPLDALEVAPTEASASSGGFDEKGGSILKSPLFYLYSIWATILICTGLTLIGSAKGGAVAVGIDPVTATLLVGIISATNGLSRLINGIIFDRLGLIKVMALIAVLALAAAVSLAFAFASSIAPLFVFAALLIGFAYGGGPVLASAFAREKFGAKNFSKNLAIANLNAASAAFLSSLIITFANGFGGPVTVYAILAALLLIALVSLFFFARLYRKEQA